MMYDLLVKGVDPEVGVGSGLKIPTLETHSSAGIKACE